MEKYERIGDENATVPVQRCIHDASNAPTLSLIESVFLRHGVRIFLIVAREQRLMVSYLFIFFPGNGLRGKIRNGVFGCGHYQRRHKLCLG